MIDCPCGYGKNIKEDQKTCHVCGTDLTPLHRLKALPKVYYDEGLKLAEKGQLDGAMEKLMAAIALKSDFSAPFLEVGNIYFRKGLYDEAILQYERALALDTENVEIKEANEKANVARNQLTTVQAPTTRLKSFMTIAIMASFLGGLIIFPLLQNFLKQSVSNIPTRETIKMVILSHPELADLKLEVTRSDNGFSILGEVPSGLHKDLIKELAENIAGKMSVDFQQLTVTPPKVQPQLAFPYVVKPGETLISIAYHFYGDRQMWNRIYRENRDKIGKPEKLFTGQVLSIPIR